MTKLLIQLGQSKIILSFIIGMGFIVGYLQYSGLDTPLAPPLNLSERDSIEEFKNFKIDFSVLDDEKYKELEIFGESPVSPGVTGVKRNPFISVE